jgi:hypothetical protein
MPLTPGAFTTYDADRSVVTFTMMNEGKSVACAISTSAMDDPEKSAGTKSAGAKASSCACASRSRRAAKKFLDAEMEGNPPGIVLRSIDFRA